MRNGSIYGHTDGPADVEVKGCITSDRIWLCFGEIGITMDRVTAQAVVDKLIDAFPPEPADLDLEITPMRPGESVEDAMARKKIAELP